MRRKARLVVFVIAGLVATAVVAGVAFKLAKPRNVQAAVRPTFGVIEASQRNVSIFYAVSSVDEFVVCLDLSARKVRGSALTEAEAT